LKDREVVLCPPATALWAVAEELRGSTIAYGGQNAHWEMQGAYTGELSAGMLKDLGCRYAIVGHSERRQYFGETDATVSRKVVAARRHGLAPIVCVGENERQRDAGETRDVVVAQIRAAFADRTLADSGGVVIAYEPVWAIGTGRTPELAEVEGAHGAIRAALEDRFGAGSSAVRILYGGSVTTASAPTLMGAPGVDGALVGGASLEAGSFASIAAAAGTGTA
jgi:triosephosphate isomerase